ncbi:MAG: ABC transporter substrate-binding protein [Hyphomicrobiales bacterium]|nr:ABC transporter substrate-binding protein [Hyphomicrobiales bacterium]MDE2114207.1 ABC transporter substrate-binding protein [Hyphomicrobiales bacterium]
MQRRHLLKTLAATALAAPLAAPAIAQTAPQITWRLSSSFPANLDLLYGGATSFAQYVKEASDGRFQIQIYAPDEIVPALSNLDAVQAGKVDACHTTLAYFWGKDPTFAIPTGLPFGMNARMTNAWFYEGGGNDLVNEFLAPYSAFALPVGNTGAQMGGWFVNPIHSLAEMKGLRIRCGGLTGSLLERLGAKPDNSPMADIRGHLANHELDGVEFVSPYDDEKLDLAKVAGHYYYPGWWQPSSAQHIVMNLAKWQGLPKAYQAMVQNAAAQANLAVQARYDARNPAALRRIVTQGTKLHDFPADITDAAYKAALEIYKNASASNPKFKKMLDAYMTFRDDQYLWWQVCEYTYDNFLIRQRAKESG